jgi:hypothetical protein
VTCSGADRAGFLDEVLDPRGELRSTPSTRALGSVTASSASHARVGPSEVANQRSARNNATGHLIPNHSTAVDSAFHLLGCVGR